jgi:hypothetical protein
MSMVKEKLWRLTLLNSKETLALFLTHDDAKKFVARKNLDEYEIYPCFCELSAVEGSGLDEKFERARESVSVDSDDSGLASADDKISSE